MALGLPGNCHQLQPTKGTSTEEIGSSNEAKTGHGAMSCMNQVTKERLRCANGHRRDRRSSRQTEYQTARMQDSAAGQPHYSRRGDKAVGGYQGRGNGERTNKCIHERSATNE